MRVFSARNYQGKIRNDGCVLLVGRTEGSESTLLIRPQALERTCASDFGTEICDRLAAEPFCPRGHLMTLQGPNVVTGGCLMFRGWRERDDNVECNECGAEDLQERSFFRCGGCADYSLCLQCVDMTMAHRNECDGRRIQTMDQ